ncbi:MAG: hypothetical protein DRO40_01950 [Thermoprotei archaeon]|nr:MAG: hypothetical protein DRO40_01950 [Thermoprotei archaeon]
MRLNIKILSLTIIALLIITMVTPFALVYAEDISEEAPEQPVVEERGFLDNVAFEELLDLAYMVRNETYPLLEWAIEHGSTIAERIKTRGDWFFNKAMEFKDVDERYAKAAIVTAIVTYSGAPVSAHQVLVITKNENRRENGTITNETVKAIHEIASELKELATDARDYALDNNVYLPYIVEMFLLRGEYRLELSLQKLEENRTGLAFALAITGYIDYAKAYGVIVRSTIIDFIREHGSNVRSFEMEIGIINENEARDRIERLRARLPTWITIKVMKGNVNITALPLDKEALIDRLTNCIMNQIEKIANNKPMIKVSLVNRYGMGWKVRLRMIIRNRLMGQFGQVHSLREVIKNLMFEVLGQQHGVEVPHTVIIAKRR